MFLVHWIRYLVCTWILKVQCGRVFPPPTHPCLVTSLGCSCRQRLLFHHASMPATRQARSRPAARKQKMPAKLCNLRERPSGCVAAWLLRSHRPVLGHHFCFMMSRSPFSCSSKILQQYRERGSFKSTVYMSLLQCRSGVIAARAREVILQTYVSYYLCQWLSMKPQQKPNTT